MKRRDLIGLLIASPLLLGFQSKQEAPKLSIQDALIEFLKKEIKYDTNFSWMVDEKEPCIGPKSIQPVAVLVNNNCITVRIIGDMFDQVPTMAQRDMLIDLISASFVDQLYLDIPQANGPTLYIEIKGTYTTIGKTIVKYGQYIHYQHVIVNYEKC